MNAWFDPLTDILFRPFIKTPLQGAATAIHLALSEDVNGKSGCCYANCKEKKLSEHILNHPAQSKLWDDTEALLRSHNLLDKKYTGDSWNILIKTYLCTAFNPRTCDGKLGSIKTNFE